MSDLRTRIYQHYVHARGESLAPATVAGFAPRASTLRSLIKRHLPADCTASIFDLGCGHGALIYFLRQAGYHNVVGVDISPEQVAEATRLGIEGIREGNLLETLRNLPDHSRDVVIAFDVIEHFTKDELLPFVGAIRYGDMTHEQAFTRVSLAQLLLSSGFSRLECHESGTGPAGFKSTARWVLWRGIRLLLRVWVAAETGDLGRDAIYTRNLLAVAYKGSGSMKEAYE